MLSFRATTVVKVIGCVLFLEPASSQAQTDCNGNGIDHVRDVAYSPLRRVAYQFATATRF